jgi:hypothetical protein
MAICNFHHSTNYASTHKARIFTEYHSVFPLVGIRTLTPPHSPASVPLPPEPTGGRTRLRVWGWGSPNSDDGEKLSTLPTLCPYPLLSSYVSLSKVWPTIQKWYT